MLPALHSGQSVLVTVGPLCLLTPLLSLMLSVLSFSDGKLGGFHLKRRGDSGHEVQHAASV